MFSGVHTGKNQKKNLEIKTYRNVYLRGGLRYYKGKCSRWEPYPFRRGGGALFCFFLFCAAPGYFDLLVSLHEPINEHLSLAEIVTNRAIDERRIFGMVKTILIPQSYRIPRRVSLSRARVALVIG